jgi:hypothetical protein
LRDESVEGTDFKHYTFMMGQISQLDVSVPANYVKENWLADAVDY